MSLRSPPPGWLMVAGRYIVEACCLWEVVALHSKRRIPTISQTVHKHRDRTPARVFLVALGVWLVHHLVIEEQGIVGAVAVAEERLEAIR